MALSLQFLADKVANAADQRHNGEDLAVPGQERGDTLTINTSRFSASVRVFRDYLSIHNLFFFFFFQGSRAGLTLHLLGNDHVPPPGETNSLVEQKGGPDSVRRDDIVILLGLVRNGRNAGRRDVADNSIRLGVRDVVDRGEESRNFGDDRVASTGSLGVVIKAAEKKKSVSLSSCQPLHTGSQDLPNDVNIVEGQFQDLPRLVAGEPVSYASQHQLPSESIIRATHPSQP